MSSSESPIVGMLWFRPFCVSISPFSTRFDSVHTSSTLPELASINRCLPAMSIRGSWVLPEQFAHEPLRDCRTSRHPRPLRPGHLRKISTHPTAPSTLFGTFAPWPTPDLSDRAKPRGLETPPAMVRFRGAYSTGPEESSFAEPRVTHRATICPAPCPARSGSGRARLRAWRKLCYSRHSRDPVDPPEFYGPVYVQLDPCLRRGLHDWVTGQPCAYGHTSVALDLRVGKK